MRHWLAAALVASMGIGIAGCRRGAAPPPGREDAYRANNRGVALLEQFKFPEAATAFRQALSLDPALAMARFNLSLALLYNQDLTGALREVTEAARELPSVPQPPYLQGLIALSDNRDDDAKGAFERVRELDARDVGAMVYLGQIYLRERAYAQAIDLLQAAAAEEPYNVTAVYNLGLALTRGGRAAEGQRALERSQTLRSIGYSVTFGTGYLEQGRYAEAIVSTGAEPELVDRTVPSAAFTPVALRPVVLLSPPTPSPFGRRFTASELAGDAGRTIAAGLGGGLTLIDFDGDGDLDVFIAAPGGSRLLRNDGHGVWTDVTAGSGLEQVPAGSVSIGCVTGDYDNDGRPDLFVLRYGTSSLYHNEGAGHFRDVTAAAGLPPYPFLAGAAAFVDVDHDGDVDLVVAGLADIAATRRPAAGPGLLFPRDFAPAPVRLLRNNGNGTFTDTTQDAHLLAATRAVAIVPTDFDNRRDIDLAIVNREGAPLLFKNLRDGTFRDVAAEVGLAAAVGPDDEVTAVTAADVNKDDFTDFFFARASGGGVFAMSDSRGRFTVTPAPDLGQGAVASQFIDYDNDGLLDLLAWSDDGPRLFRNLGNEWSDVTARAITGPKTAPQARLSSIRGLALADLDGDGNTDVVALGPSSAWLWRNSGDARHTSEQIQLKARTSNRLGIGAKVQLRAGSLTARIETSSATPSIVPADVVVGLGARGGADVVRVLWPSGVLQAETLEKGRQKIVIEELDRKPSSCPFLFTWNGERFEFVTDFMGGGEMGSWEGEGRWNRPDPVEYVRIPPGMLRPRDGRFEIRVTNELEETLFADRMRLMAVAHPPDVEVFPNEGLTDPPKPFVLFAVRDQRVPSSVVDEHGHDVTERIARVDRRYPDDFALSVFRGYADEHRLTIDLGAIGGPTVLLLTGWTDYAFSSDNLAAHQAGLSLVPPSLQIHDTHGVWRTAIADIGMPVGRPQTMVVDLAPYLRPGEHEVRIVTNMRIYWDQILVATEVPSNTMSTTSIDPTVATLTWRGFSAVVRPGGTQPDAYDYQRVSLVSPWKAMPGRYTREGDVRDLLRRSDDMFVIARSGDEISLSFDANAAGTLPGGWVRTFLLMADGFSKEMDIHSGSPDTVEPLPFHRMARYPYAAPEHYPDDADYRRYRDAFNTRTVIRSLPTLLGNGVN